MTLAPLLPAGWLPEDQAFDIVARRQSHTWIAEIKHFSVSGEAETKAAAVNDAIERLHDRFAEEAAQGTSFAELKPNQIIGLGALFLLTLAMVRLNRDRDFFRIPASAIEDLDLERETAEVLADHELMRQLAESSEDERAGRFTSLEDAKRELGLD